MKQKRRGALFVTKECTKAIIKRKESGVAGVAGVQELQEFRSSGRDMKTQNVRKRMSALFEIDA